MALVGGEGLQPNLWGGRFALPGLRTTMEQFQGFVCQICPAQSSKASILLFQGMCLCPMHTCRLDENGEARLCEWGWLVTLSSMSCNFTKLGHPPRA